MLKIEVGFMVASCNTVDTVGFTKIAVVTGDKLCRENGYPNVVHVIKSGAHDVLLR